MSHDLDTPLARQNGQLHLDDLCVFPSNVSTVFAVELAELMGVSVRDALDAALSDPADWN